MDTFAMHMFQLPTGTSPHEIIPFVVFVVFSFSCLIQLLFLWLIYSRLAFYKRKDTKTATGSGLRPVSVIICAKDEYNNLLANLPLILEQDYPDFEVLVVNDASEDDSLDLLNSFAKKYNHLRIFNLEQDLNFFSGKKFPLALGIKAASHDTVLLTDADCKPGGPEWMSRMVSNYEEGIEVVLGYGAFMKTGNFLNRLIRFDALMAAVNYLSFALAGMPYMGVGRNLSYKRELFFKARGFTTHYKVQSGDDDLFINRVARAKNTRVEISPESHTVSMAKSSFSSWLWQKKRHYTTASLYRPWTKFLLAMQYLTRVFIYGSLIALIIINYNFIFVLAVFGLFYISQVLLLAVAARKLGERDLIALMPVLEIVGMVLAPAIYISNLTHKPDRWK